jgi:hypothetical protein
LGYAEHLGHEAAQKSHALGRQFVAVFFEFGQGAQFKGLSPQFHACEWGLLGQLFDIGQATGDGLLACCAAFVHLAQTLSHIHQRHGHRNEKKHHECGHQIGK